MKRTPYPGPVVPVLLLALALGIRSASAASLTQYWPFDDGGTSSIATNAVGGGNTAKLVRFDTNAAWVTSGLPPALTHSTAAISFDGLADYVDCGNINLKGHGTISLWINPATYSGDERLWGQLQAVTPFAGVVHFDTYGTGNLQVYDDAGLGWINLAPMSGVPAGSWTHLAFVYDYGTLQLWVNGVQQQQFPGANSGADFNASNFGLGALFEGFGAHYGGLMDDVSIWDGPLSSNSIARLANGASPTAIKDVPVPGRLVQYWPLEEASGSAIAANAVTGGNPGVLTNLNPATAWVAGNIAPNLAARSKVALAFDGLDDDCVDLGNLMLNSEGTLSFWINPATVTSTNGGIRLFSHLTLPGEYAGPVGIDCSPAGPGGIAVFDGVWNPVSLDGALSTNTWHHLALVYSKGLVTLFINGAPQLTASSRLNFDTAEIGLGAPFALAYGDPFNGLMDDVSIWDKALSPATIQLLASGQSPLTVVDTTNQAPVAITMKVTTETSKESAQLVAYYPLDETTGLLATNAVAGGNTAYLSNYVAGLAPWVTSGLPAPLTHDISAVALDGVSEYVDLGDIGLTNAGTISLWINPTVVGPDARIYCQESGTVTTVPGCAELGFNGSGSVNVWSGTAWLAVAPAGTMVANQWAHLVFVYSSGFVTLYINGVEQSTVAAGLDFSGASFGLGCKFFLLYGTPFAGMMDDLAIWNDALTAANVQSLAAGVSPLSLGAAATLVDYYPFDGTGSSVTVSNLVAGGSNGRLVNYSPTVQSWESANLPPALPYSKAALSFDGAEDFLDLGNLGLSGSGTVSFWMFPDTLAGDRRLFSQLSGTTTNQAGATGFDSTGAVWAWTGAAGTQPLLAPAGTLTTNQWFHMAFLYGGGTGTLYVNGVQQQSASVGFDFADAEFGLGATFFYILHIPGQYGAPFGGLIDDVSIWDRPVSPGTVARLAAGAKPPEMVGSVQESLVITWPAYPPGLTLEATSSLPAGPGGWTVVTPPVKTVGLNIVATVPILSGSRYFRLTLPAN